MWPTPYGRVAFLPILALLFGCARGAEANGFDLELASLDGGPIGDGFVLSGEVTGLEGSGLVLRNGSDRVRLSAVAGSATIPFTFPVRVPAGTSYGVVVETNPSAPSQECTVSAGEGKANADVTSVRVTCTTGATSATGPFKIGGSIRGLIGTLTLQNNDAETLDVTAPPSGAPLTFAFPTALETGRSYAVTVVPKAGGPTCAVTGGGTGTVGNADVNDVVVSCSGSQTFNATGAPQLFTVPAGISEVTIEAWGAQGNRNVLGVVGALGGYATGKLGVTGGQVLHVYVGGGDATSIAGGFNGGGAAGPSPCANARGGGGGGASDVRTGTGGFGDRVIVAGGGGGAGGNRIGGCGRGTGGGGGGGWFGGGAGFPGATAGALPTGGTQAAGGTGGTSTYVATNNGAGGASGLGGAGGGEESSNQSGSNAATTGGVGGGASGGGGLYAGDMTFTGQGGAGGSGYVGSVTAGSTTAGGRSGSGQIIIRFGP
ncbi:MAG: hypothetical protein KF819_16325 [Labilithrix sp.]|nr:hypothetical protein [Labilithrix sp.]